MRKSLFLACILVCAGAVQAQPSGPGAAAYQTALSKCSAGSASNAQAFDACMKVQGFSAPVVPAPSPVGVQPPQMTIQPYPMPLPTPTPGAVPGAPGAVRGTPDVRPPAEPLARQPKTIETECRVANGDGKFYEACLKSNGLKDTPSGTVSSPIQQPGNGTIPPGPYLVPPAFNNPGVPPQ